jgi:caa(3)-type oxidase subunit IV
MTHTTSTHEHHEHSAGGPKLYLAVLGALLVLTVVTVYAAGFDFGSMNVLIALAIATAKGSLVALYFMHLRHDRFNALLFLGGMFFLAVFLIFSLFDVSWRDRVLPGNLKQAPLEFPGAPLNKRIQPSTGQPLGTPPPEAAPTPTPAAPAPAAHK